MRLRLLISLNLLLLLAGQKAGAQIAPADDFFHSGARYYISNSIPEAKAVVEQGRKLYPNDEKLKKLEELLNQQQQQQSQQSQSQQQQSQQQKSEDQKKQQQQNQKNSQDQQKQGQQKQADQKKDEQQKQPDQQKSEADKDKSGEDKKDQAQPVKAGEMTPEEAKKLLDAQKDNEQLLQFRPPDKPRDPSRPVKDW